MSLIPLPYRILIYAIILAGSAAIGAWTMHKVDLGSIEALKLSYAEAADAANKKAQATTQALTDGITQAALYYEQEKSDEKTKSDAIVANLRSGTQQLRVTLARSQSVPKSPTSSSGTQSADSATLDRSVAANLESYAVDEYNAIADKLDLCKKVYADVSMAL